ncbi:MAG: porin family protein [candidate division Zixibacteria bacterium]|nr:porin family protein [candidate division Zixibacteria bacterium]
MIKSKSLLIAVSVIIVLILKLNTESMANKYIYLTTDIGISYSGINCTLDDYWYDGLVLSAGCRLPLFLTENYISLKTSFEYHYYAFDRGASIPIQTVDGERSVTINGKSTSIFSLRCIPTFYIYNESKPTRPFITCGIGIIKRSNTVLKSDNQYNIDSNLKHESSTILSLGFGLDFKIDAKLRGVIDYNYNIDDSKYDSTHYTIFSFGVAYLL